MELSTDKQCEHASTDKVQADFKVKGSPGLALRITSAGHKSWTLRYRRADGKQRRLTLGTYPEVSLKEARERTRQAMNEVSGGDDPATAKQDRRHAETFGDLFEYWYTSHAEPNLDRPELERERYDYHLKAALGGISAKELRKPDISKVRDAIAKTAPVQSNRVLALINRVLNYAVAEDLIEFNPAHRMRKAGPEQPRDRVLSDAELAKVWQSLDEAEHWKPTPGEGARGRTLSLTMVRALRLLLLTGQRRGEVIGTAASEVDLVGGLWTISKERAKNGVAHRVPLAPLALFQFRRAMAESAELPSKHAAWAFPSDKVDGEHTREDAVTKAGARLFARLKIEGATVHDLRRTVGTGMARLKVSKEIREKVLNHTRGAKGSMTTAVYDRHGYDDEKLEALAKWEAYVRKVVGLTAENVTMLRGGA
jgi:integrase